MLNKLTFAIPIYISTPRIEQYLHECIQSIIDQSDENWELLISNDCSPIKIDLSRYTDKRIKIFTQEKNIGMFKGWNYLLNKTETEFFIPIGQDDIIGKDFVKKSREVLNKNKNIDAIYVDNKNIDGDGNIYNENSSDLTEGFHKSGRELLNYRVKNSLNFQLTFFYSPLRTKLLKQLGGFPDFGTITDTYVSYLTANFFNTYYIKETLFYVRKHSDNESNNLKRIFKEQKILIPYLIEYFKKDLSDESFNYLKKLNQTIFRRYIISIIYIKVIKILQFLGIYKIIKSLSK